MSNGKENNAQQYENILLQIVNVFEKSGEAYCDFPRSGNAALYMA
jgi:hypothetical protein